MLQTEALTESHIEGHKRIKSLKLGHILNLLNVLDAELFHKNICPLYFQLEYSYIPLLYGMVLEVTVKSKKTFVAATNIKLEDELLDKETWFNLGNCSVWRHRKLHRGSAASRGCSHTEGKKPSRDLTDCEWDKFTWAKTVLSHLSLFIGCKLNSIQSYIHWKWMCLDVVTWLRKLSRKDRLLHGALLTLCIYF